MANSIITYESKAKLNLEWINENATSHEFAECKGKIVLKEGVTEIGIGAFEGCEELTSITLPDSITVIGTYAFHECYRLKSIDIPNSVTYIGRSAFNCCYCLESIKIPDSVVKIGQFMFSRCRNLKEPIYNANSFMFFPKEYASEYRIPNGIQHIVRGAFSRCAKLTSVVIPDSVTSIGKYAFVDCTGLESINIPDSVTEIEDGAFSKCDKLPKETLDRIRKINEKAITINNG